MNYHEIYHIEIMEINQILASVFACTVYRHWALLKDCTTEFLHKGTVL